VTEPGGGYLWRTGLLNHRLKQRDNLAAQRTGEEGSQDVPRWGCLEGVKRLFISGGPTTRNEERRMGGRRHP